ncbi:MAG: FAD-dependent oxidoreductase, partial [Polyangiales bacterium]
MTNRFTRRRFVRVTGGAAAAASIGGSGLVRAAAADEGGVATRHVNLVVIGAGLSGLMAGRELRKRGVDSFVVLEARERVGGRTLNMPIGGGHIVEVGGEWIGPGQNAIATLIDELGIGAFDHYYDGDTTYDIEGRISRGLLPDVSLSEAVDFGRAAWQLDRLAKKMPVGEPWRMPDAAALDQATLGNWLREHASTSF